MKAPKEVLEVWRRFDTYPMETLTKAWYSTQPVKSKQRSVHLMKEHRELYGTSGNCFDLAIWLVHEFNEAGIEAYGVGHDLFTSDAHVAVIALYNGYKYFCDLGDMWVQPILVDPRSSDFTEELVDSFFPAAQVSVRTSGDQFTINYVRPNGKISSQTFEMNLLAHDVLRDAGEHCQNILWSPLVEKRIFLANEVQHWEFDQDRSFFSTNEGLFAEEPLGEITDWAKRIHERTGISKEIIRKSLEVYTGIKKDSSKI